VPRPAKCHSHVYPTPKALYDHLYIMHRLRGDELRAVEARVYDAEEAQQCECTIASIPAIPNE